MAREEGEEETKRGRGRSKRAREASPSSSSSSYSSSSPSSSDSRSPEPRSRSSKRKKSSHRHHHKKKSSRSRKSSRDDNRRRRRRRRREEERGRSSRGRRGDADSSDSASEEAERAEEAREIVRVILSDFPAVAGELRQLLQMIDSGEGIDISGISDKPLVKLLKKLFRSLKLKESVTGAYLLPPKGLPTLDVVGSLLSPRDKLPDDQNQNSVSPNRQEPSPSNFNVQNKDDNAAVQLGKANGEEDPPPKRRIIGPAMPSRELLAAAAEMTEALRDADMEADNDLLIGPPPPAMVAEAESANEAERFEEITRIVGADANSPYDVLGVNWKMSSDNIKKRYWKLSLMVHPDKCPHPSAQEAFVKLNSAFKDLQDPDKRGAIDEKIKNKEELEKFEVELKAMREAAQWRRLQGISLEGDDELLAVPKQAPTRDEWMTTLPPERKPGVTMHSTTTFSRTGKEGRGDTSVWTDNPLDRTQKAKQNYLEAYNKAKAIAEADEEKITSSDASMVDKYNSSKRSMSLVQKHQEKRQKKKKQKQPEKEEWEGNHPWKPWDRENDLSAGRQKVNLDPENMSQGLSSRFASGAVQRNFL